MAEKKAVQSPRYSREELLANAEALFSVKPEVLAGALHGIEQTDFSIDEIKSIIDKFLKRKVN